MSPGPVATTWLFVPGDRPDRFDKARNSRADEVICDLEDAVVPEAKDAARDAVRRWLSGGGAGWVRVNGLGTPWHEADLDGLVGLAGLRGIVVPKAANPAALRQLGRRIGPLRVIALIESARGLQLAGQLAACRVVARLAFGSIDFAGDIDVAEDEQSMLFARSTLVVASRAAGKPAPIDGVTTALNDATAVQVAAEHARRLGFGGKLCIHPAQVPLVAAAFRPAVADIRWAEGILRAVSRAGAGAARHEGKMIDKPVIDRGRRIIERAGIIEQA